MRKKSNDLSKKYVIVFINMNFLLSITKLSFFLYLI